MDLLFDEDFMNIAIGFETPASAATCSFCHKERHEVAKLVCGSEVSICDECVQLVAEIMGFKLVKEQVFKP